MNAPQSPQRIAELFGCTDAQARTQLANSAKQLRAMAEKAKAAGKYQGQTFEQLSARAEAFEQAAAQ